MVVPFGHSPEDRRTQGRLCKWVITRLERYCVFDLPPLEFHRIEQHLQTCANCSEAHDRIHRRIAADVERENAELGLASSEEISRRVIEDVRQRKKTGERYHSKYLSDNEIDAIYDEVATDIKVYDGILKLEKEIGLTFPPVEGASASPTPRRRWNRALAMAASLLVVIGVPVLACVGHAAWKAYTGSASEETTTTASSDSVDRSVLSEGSDGGTVESTTASESDAAAMSTDTIEATLGAELHRIAQEAIAKAEVDAMLPHTEEECEAWARREYPHIMWLYDVWAGKEGTDASGASPERRRVCPFFATEHSPAVRMVIFGTDDNGNPSITLPDAEGNMVTLCAIRDGETLALQDVSASPSGGFSSCVSFSPEKETWDGVPVNIPDWGKRLYANTPESQRPTGWRAVLIYSGEIFKFDYPKSLDEPNCVPTMEAMLAAAEILGFAVDVAVPQAERDDFPADNITEYASALATDILQAQAILGYIHNSAVTVGAPRFDEIADSACGVLGDLCRVPNVQCATDSLVKALTSLFDVRREALCATEDPASLLGALLSEEQPDSGSAGRAGQTLRRQRVTCVRRGRASGEKQFECSSTVVTLRSRWQNMSSCFSLGQDTDCTLVLSRMLETKRGDLL
jgi:hypothetical protein